MVNKLFFFKYVDVECRCAIINALMVFVLILQLDCGIHPGLSGMDALPFVDLIEADQIDLLLISQ